MFRFAHGFGAAIIAATCVFAAAAPAHDVEKGDLHIEDPYVRASIGRAPNSAAFMTIHNLGITDDRLTSARSDVSDRVEIHTTLMSDGVMRMRQLKQGIPVPGAETVTLKPGGMHVMFLGLKQKLVAGENLKLTLVFEKAGELEMSVPIRKISSRGKMMKHNMHGKTEKPGMKMDHNKMDQMHKKN